MKIAAILASLALTVPAKSFTCNVGGDWGDDHRDCSKTSDAEGALADICYYDKSGTAGCMPTKYEMLIVEAGKAGCTDNGCWCMTSDCNTQAWFDSFKASYVPPPQCYSGIAGANQGPQCKKTDLYEQLEFKAECYNKLTQNMCVENNPWLGHGDGCQDDGRKEGGKELCESYQDGTRDADDSYDGTTKHCIWMPPLNTEEEKRSACESELNDDGSNMCAYNNNSMSCEQSAASTAKMAAWMQQRGSLDCESRLPIGCVENNDSNGKSEKCTDMTDESSCLAVAHDCSQGTCAGTANSGPACENRNSQYECEDNGEVATNCQWTYQCCKWFEEPVDKEQECLTNGAGTEKGVCKYVTGDGPPEAEVVEAGFEYGLFHKGPKFAGKCAIVASFRTGFGSATVLGSDTKGMVHGACENTAYWDGLAEHVGHNEATIDEYCTNFVPGDSAMPALEQYSPSELIQKAKDGKFDEVFPGLKHLMYLVTSKDDFGTCLFTAESGVWGAAICTCDSEGCNGQSALELLVDPDEGPMRLLQFIDGSLAHLRDEINAIVPDLFTEDGTINEDQVNYVTEEDIDTILLIPDVANVTNKEELWGIVQDFQAMGPPQPEYTGTIKVQGEVDVQLAMETSDCEEGSEKLMKIAKAQRAALAAATSLKGQFLQTKKIACKEGDGRRLRSLETTDTVIEHTYEVVIESKNVVASKFDSAEAVKTALDSSVAENEGEGSFLENLKEELTSENITFDAQSLESSILQTTEVTGDAKQVINDGPNDDNGACGAAPGTLVGALVVGAAAHALGMM